MEKTDFLYADTNSRKLKITLIIFCLTWSKVGMAFKFTYFKNELINNANTNSGKLKVTLIFFLVDMARNGYVHLGHEILKSAVSWEGIDDELRWFFLHPYSDVTIFGESIFDIKILLVHCSCICFTLIWQKICTL